MIVAAEGSALKKGYGSEAEQPPGVFKKNFSFDRLAG
jgi:hypothetical protein